MLCLLCTRIVGWGLVTEGNPFRGSHRKHSSVIEIMLSLWYNQFDLNLTEAITMSFTYRRITYWKDNNFKARSWQDLASNNEEVIIKWLYQQGVIFKHCWGMECHDIGDTDYFSGSTDVADINTLLAFIDKIFGEWRINATYDGIDITVSKPYPNIMHFFSIKYPGEREATMLNLFERFEQEFCHTEIKEVEKTR